ncbi:hypothetical protein GCM10020000_15890 [Streptomyces olivoverticillatus]
MLTSRLVSGGTRKPSGSLDSWAPAGISVSSRPPKDSGTGRAAAAAPLPWSATVTRPIRTGRCAKVFSSRSRVRGPPALLCTISRSVRSVHATGEYPDVDAAQLPVHPFVGARRAMEKT